LNIAATPVPSSFWERRSEGQDQQTQVPQVRTPLDASYGRRSDVCQVPIRIVGRSESEGGEEMNEVPEKSLKTYKTKLAWWDEIEGICNKQAKKGWQLVGVSGRAPVTLIFCKDVDKDYYVRKKNKPLTA